MKKKINISFREIKELYTSKEQKNKSVKNKLGMPGHFPYTRGIHESMYRGRLWTMRQFAGFGSPEDTNKRFKYLLAHGQTGLSTAFDMPSLMGYDADHPRSKGEVGREGVSVSSIEDMERLFSGIDQTSVTVSMTINATATIIMAMYLAIAKRRKVDFKKIGGTIQNDMLKEFIAQKEWISPVKPSVNLTCDIIEYCAKHAPRFNGVSISGYHIREAGATAVQELAFTIADGLAYVDNCIGRGMKIDEFANRLSFFFDVHNDFFEEIAKFRAARRLWSRLLKERYKVLDPNSLKLRTHAQTAGVSLTAQQPLNNVARVSLQALAAVLGGVQSLHTNSMDETLSLPTEEAVKVALRTQQIIAEESGVINTADPLGGSFYLESLTDQIEKESYDYIKKIDKLGGMLNAVEKGFPQKEISESAYRFQLMVESEEYSIVGVNKYQDSIDQDIPTLHIDFKAEKKQIEKLKAFKRSRNQKNWVKACKKLEKACKENRNVMPELIEGVNCGMTLGEISDIYRKIFGIYNDSAYI
jgi:methylmalonyl-CoA mutase N-terminal domain/subunit